MFKKSLVRALAVVSASSLVLAGQAHAAAMTLPSEITDATASVAVVGAGVFAIAVGIKLYKWISRAL